MDLDAVVGALAPRLLAYACARTGNRSLAEDVAQDALTALVQSWRRHGPPDSPEAFTFAIAKRRAGRAVARRALLAPLDRLLRRQSSAVPADTAFEHREALTALLLTMRRLSRGDREALLLSAAGELRIGEIAAVTGATPAAVKMRRHRARQRLAALQLGDRHEHAPATD